MKRPNRRAFCCALISAILPLSATCRERAAGSGNDPFPRKPIKVIVPFPAGGGSDTFTRIMQKAVRDGELLPQPLVVINVPGAGGTIGSRRVRNSQADGYTILNLHEGILSSKYSGRAPYGPEAFRPIAATGRSGLVICVRDDSPYRTLPDLMAAAKGQPDHVLFGMAQGTPTHFAGRKLEIAAGDARFRLVASGGGAKRLADLLGGHIDATPFSLAESTKFAASGVRALAYLGEQRHPDIQELPTARESGLDVVMTHVQYWWAPKATPDHAVERIAAALEAAMQTEFVRGKLDELKIEPLFLRGEELRQHLVEREADFAGAALVHYRGLPNLVVPVVVIVVALASAVALRGLRRWRMQGKSRSRDLAGWRYLAATTGILAAYVAAMQSAGLGFAIATCCFVPLMGLAAGSRSRRGLLLLFGTGALLGWGCFVVFTELLVIDLP